MQASRSGNLSGRLEINALPQAPRLEILEAVANNESQHQWQSFNTSTPNLFDSGPEDGGFKLTSRLSNAKPTMDRSTGSQYKKGESASDDATKRDRPNEPSSEKAIFDESDAAECKLTKLGPSESDIINKSMGRPVENRPMFSSGHLGLISGDINAQIPSSIIRPRQRGKLN